MDPDLQNGQSENNSESTTKRPGKVLPCPHCDSANTEFCYFNRSNSAQPWHFCKNCRRYQTAGRTMRKVPVGSGRRKNKNAIALNCGQIMVSKSNQASPPCGKIFDFGSNAHAKPWESFTLKPKFGQKSHNCFQNGLNEPERKELSLDRSSITSLDSVENGRKVNSVNGESVVMDNSRNCSPGIWIFPCIYSPSCDSQILGKHSSKTETLLNPEENNLWFPKTLRIGDPSESSKSSIWSTPEIKNEKNDFIKGKVACKALKSSENDVHYQREHSLVLQANPAALARSLNFHEHA